MGSRHSLQVWVYEKLLPVPDTHRHSHSTWQFCNSATSLCPHLELDLMECVRDKGVGKFTLFVGFRLHS